MTRFRAGLMVAGVFLILLAVQGLIIVGISGEGANAPALESAVRNVVRDDGPLMERIPAPWVVLTILGGALVSMGIWYALVRWTDISEGW